MELLDLKVDLFVIPVQVTTAKRLIKTTPIVMISNLDPVDHGVIYSLERPGGNITGVTTLSRTLIGRDRSGRSGIKYDPGALRCAWLDARLGGRLQSGGQGGCGCAFDADAFTDQPPETDYRAGVEKPLPTGFEGSTWVEAGGLVSYSADEPALFRRAAT